MPAAPPFWSRIARLLICLLAGAPGLAQAQTLQRDIHSGWQFRKWQTGEWRPADVPGAVQTDLFAAGILPDPYFRMNAHAAEWVELEDWEYRCALQISPEELAADRQILHFDGLDTYAEVFLNGRKILYAHNMFRMWSVDVTGRLKGKDDSLRIRFFSPRPIADSLAALRPYRLPADSDPYRRSVYTRKAGYQFGWDFAPRIVTMGIWRPIRLECWRKVHIPDPFTTIHTLSISPQVARMEVESSIEARRPGNYQIVLEVDGRVVAELQKTFQTQAYDLHIPFEIKDPQLWWPAGSGEAHLYNFTLRVLEEGREIARHDQRFGIRKVRLVQEPDSIGRSFYFEVNGRPIFIKGTNYVPGDLFPQRARARMAPLFKAMTATHMNMVRVWGGGIYPDDEFYDACDSLGILVWQDFMFAGGMYPGDSGFAANVHDEVRGEILRLRRHPSLALWCGNNEMDVAWHNWGWQQTYDLHGADSAEVWQTYQRIFMREIPDLLKEFHPDASYLSSSPISNWGKPEFLLSGNQHDWEVWHGGASIDVLGNRAARFVTEYGFQSYPALSTLAPYSNPDDLVMDSEWMRDRQKSYKGNAPILTEIERQFGRPRDFSAFLTLSQLVQARAMELAIKAHRTRRPHCMGTLYWQLNDCWPGPSWSTVDYLGRWKAGHYALQRLYAPVLIRVSQAGGDVVAHIASDLRMPRAAKLRFCLKSFTGKVLGQQEVGVTLAADSAWEALHMPLKRLDKRFDPATTLLEASLMADGEVLASDVYYFVGAPEQRLPMPKFSYAVEADGDHHLLKITSHHLMRCVEIRVEGMAAEFSDNYFDFLPGASYEIELRNVDGLDAHGLRERLRFRDLTLLVE